MDIAGLLTLILVLAVVGFLVWLLITYVPMPDVFRKVIIVVVVIAVVLWLISQLGGGQLDFPSLN